MCFESGVYILLVPQYVSHSVQTVLYRVRTVDLVSYPPTPSRGAESKCYLKTELHVFRTAYVASVASSR